MKIDLDALNPKKMLKRFVSFFLGLFTIRFLNSSAIWMDLSAIFAFTLAYMFLYTLWMVVQMIAMLHVFKSQTITFKAIFLIKVIDYFISWFIFFLISIILKGIGDISLIETILGIVIVEILYIVMTYKKEGPSCQKNQF